MSLGRLDDHSMTIHGRHGWAIGQVFRRCWPTAIASLHGFVSANTVRQKAAALVDANEVIALMVKARIAASHRARRIPGFAIHLTVQLQPTRPRSRTPVTKARKERWRERHRNADGTQTERRTERHER